MDEQHIVPSSSSLETSSSFATVPIPVAITLPVGFRLPSNSRVAQSPSVPSSVPSAFLSPSRNVTKSSNNNKGFASSSFSSSPLGRGLASSSSVTKSKSPRSNNKGSPVKSQSKGLGSPIRTPPAVINASESTFTTTSQHPLSSISSSSVSSAFSIPSSIPRLVPGTRPSASTSKVIQDMLPLLLSSPSPGNSTKNTILPQHHHSLSSSLSSFNNNSEHKDTINTLSYGTITVQVEETTKSSSLVTHNASLKASSPSETIQPIFTIQTSTIPSDSTSDSPSDSVAVASNPPPPLTTTKNTSNSTSTISVTPPPVTIASIKRKKDTVSKPSVADNSNNTATKFTPYPTLMDTDKAIYQYKHAAEGPHQEYEPTSEYKNPLEWYQTLMEQNLNLSSSVTAVSALRTSKNIRNNYPTPSDQDENGMGISSSIHAGMFCPPLRNNIYYAPSDYTVDHPDESENTSTDNMSENEGMIDNGNNPTTRMANVSLPLPKHELQLSHLGGFGYCGNYETSFSSSSSSAALAIVQQFGVRRSYSNVKVPLCYVAGKSIMVIDFGTYLPLDITMNSFISLTDTLTNSSDTNTSTPPVNFARNHNSSATTVDNPLRSSSSASGSNSGSLSGKNSVVISPFVHSNISTVGSITGGFSRNNESSRSLLHPSVHGISSSASTVTHASAVATETTGRRQRIYTKHLNPVTQMITHPFLPIIASSENLSNATGSLIRVWHANTLEDLTNPLDCSYTVHSLGFSSNGYYLVAVLFHSPTKEYVMNVWDLQELALPSTTTDSANSSRLSASDGTPALVLPCNRFAPPSVTVSSSTISSIRMVTCSPCPDPSLTVGWPDILFLYNGQLVMLSFSRIGPEAPLQANILEGDNPSDTLTTENTSNDNLAPTAKASSSFYVQAIHFLCQGIELIAVTGQEGWIRILAGTEIAAELVFTPVQPIIALALLPIVNVLRHKNKDPTNDLSNGAVLAVSFADGSVSLVYCNFDPESSTVNVQIVDTFTIDSASLSVLDTVDTLSSTIPSSIVARNITGSIIPRSDGTCTAILGIETSAKQLIRTTRYLQSKNGQVSVTTNTDSLKSGNATLSISSPLYPSVLQTLESGRWASTILTSIAHPYLPIYALGHSNGTVTVWDALYNIWIGTIDAPVHPSSPHTYGVSCLDFSAEGCVLGVAYTPIGTHSDDSRTRSQVIVYRITLPAPYLRKISATSYARNIAVTKYKTAHKILRTSLNQNVSGKKNIDPQLLQHTLFAIAARWYLSPKTTGTINHRPHNSEIPSPSPHATLINCMKFAPLGTPPGGNSTLPTRGTVKLPSVSSNPGSKVTTDTNFEQHVSFHLTLALGLSDGNTEIYVVNAALPSLPSPSITPSIWSTASSSLHPSAVASSKMEETRVQRRKIFRWMYHQPNIVAAALGDPAKVAAYINIGVNGLDWDTNGRYIQVSMSNYELVVWEACATGSASYVRKIETVRDTVWSTQTNLLGWNVSGIWYQSIPLLLSNSTNLYTVPMEPLFNEVQCITKNNSGNDIVVTGGTDGRLRLYRYPAVAPLWTKNHSSLSYREYGTVHSQPIGVVSFGGTGSDEYLLSTATNDNGAGVAVWELKWPKEFTDVLVTETSGIAEAPSAIAHAKAASYVRPVTNAVMMDPIRDMLRRYTQAVNNLMSNPSGASVNNFHPVIASSSSSTPGNHSTSGPNSGRVSPFAQEMLQKMTENKQLIMFANPSASNPRSKGMVGSRTSNRSSPNIIPDVTSSSSSPMHLSSSSETDVLQSVPFSIPITTSFLPDEGTIPLTKRTNPTSSNYSIDGDQLPNGGTDELVLSDAENIIDHEDENDSDQDNINDNDEDDDNTNDNELNGDNSYQDTVKRLEERVVINSAVQTHENTLARNNELRLQSLQGFVAANPHRAKPLNIRGKSIKR